MNYELASRKPRVLEEYQTIHYLSILGPTEENYKYAESTSLE